MKRNFIEYKVAEYPEQTERGFRIGSYLQTGLFVTNNILLPLTFIIDSTILMMIVLTLHLSDNHFQ